MSYTEPVRRVDTVGRYGKPSHHYVDGTGQRLPGVTTILSEGMPKPALVGWGIKTTAEYAVNHWDELAEAEISERLSTLKGAPYADRDAAARRGTEVHGLAEQLVSGAEIDVPTELAGHVAAYVRFLDEWDVQPILTESVVYSLRYGYAGSLDLVADFRDGKRRLCDVKTTRSGVYGETAYQLAAYRFAEKYLDAEGNPQDMLEVDECAVIHVRGDGYDLIPVRTDDRVLKEFRHIAVVAKATKDCRSYVARPLAAPSEQVAS